jgi:hypothetical protein
MGSKFSAMPSASQSALRVTTINMLQIEQLLCSLVASSRRRWRFSMRAALMLTALLLVCGVAQADVAPPPPDPAEGRWYGAMRQVDVDGEQSYPMTLTLNESGGSTDYPKLSCGGELERLGTASGGYVIYKETITRGAFDKGKGNGCVDGVVIIHTDGNQIVLGWFGAFDGDPMVASAKLARGQINSK